MLIVRENDIEHDPIYKVTTDDGSFYISMGGNLDLYWTYFASEKEDKADLPKEFIISKENYPFYSLVKNLYDAVKNGNPYQDNSNKQKGDIVNYMKDYLFINDNIVWRSDESNYDDANILKIGELNEDALKVSFIKGKDKDLYDPYNVRIRNSGSRYKPYNAVFMKMYNDLNEQNLDEENHQIHMEEYCYKKKLELTKKNR